MGTGLQTYNPRHGTFVLETIEAALLCLSFPGKIVAIRDEFASVDYGPDGVRHNVNISLIDAEVGGYVLVQGGFAIRVLSRQEAEEALETWKMIREEFQEPLGEVQAD